MRRDTIRLYKVSEAREAWPDPSEREGGYQRINSLDANSPPGIFTCSAILCKFLFLTYFSRTSSSRDSAKH